MAEYIWSEADGTQGDVVPRVRTARFSEGYEQRAPDGLNHIDETWDVQHRDVEQAIKEEIDAFIRPQMGVGIFDWAPPGEAITKRFVCTSYRPTRQTGGYWTISLRFERRYEPAGQALPAAPVLRGAALGMASATGALAVGRVLQGAAQGQGAAAGALAHGVPLSGAASAAAMAAGTLTVASGVQRSFSAGRNSANTQQATSDTFLYDLAPNNNWSANNIFPILTGAGENWRYLINGDARGMIDIDRGALALLSVDDVRLHMFRSAAGSPVTVAIYPAAAANNTAQATWNNSATGTPWSQPGAVAAGATPLGSILLGAGIGEYVSDNLAAVVNNAAWRAGGLVLVATTLETSASVTADTQTDGSRPYFSFTYTRAAA